MVVAMAGGASAAEATAGMAVRGLAVAMVGGTVAAEAEAASRRTIEN